MPISELTPTQWMLALLAATGVGVSKSGLPGISLLHVVLFAHLFPGIQSTGIVLPLLVAGDLGAVALFRRHAHWPHVIRTLPPAVLGVVVGWAFMGRIPSGMFNPLIGGIVLALAGLQALRDWNPQVWQRVPHTTWFAWSMGFLAGVTTMVANAAGPVMGLYLLAVALPKDVFVGTAAWFFLLINLFKIPFSLQLGLIHPSSLAFNLALTPAIAAGLFLGRWVVTRLSQRWFDALVLVFAVAASLRLLGVL